MQLQNSMSRMSNQRFAQSRKFKPGTKQASIHSHFSRTSHQDRLVCKFESIYFQANLHLDYLGIEC